MNALGTTRLLTEAMGTKMRDPKRIDVVLSELRDIWLKNPDLRLGQIVVNCAQPIEPQPAIFHIEDDDLLEGLRRYRAELQQP